MKQLAIFGILSRKLQEKEIKVVDDLNIKSRKTKEGANLVKNFRTSPRESFLIIPSKENKTIYPAVRNLTRVGVSSPESLNSYELLKYQKILLDQKAIETITKHYKL